jgi:glutathione S-transferase
VSNTLYIGNRNYSSWSLRPWLVLQWGGIPFVERDIRLDQPGYGAGGIAEVLKFSPTGRVPCLHAGNLVIWDSLAIAEWAAEEKPQAGLWPSDRARRATARSVVAEMHSGFPDVRRQLTMNIRRRCPAQDWEPATRAQLARLDQIWIELRTANKSDGPWLFGRRSIADAFYAPVATRMRTYGVPLSPDAQAWCDTVFADTAFREWEAAARPDSWDKPGFPVIDKLYSR